MRFAYLVVGAMACAALGAPSLAGVAAQAPAGGGTAEARVHADLLQVMRGVLYPASNVIFAAQSEDPATIKPATPDPSTSPNPLTSAYGGWTAVENAALALAESANLLVIPGRACANGRPVPVQNADWQQWVQELRDAGMAAYRSAQSKDQDAILDAAGTVSDACANCHDTYREVAGGVANRC